MLNSEKHNASIKTLLSEKALDTGFEYWLRQLDETDTTAVESVLSKPPASYSFEKLLTLISPIAEDYLEQMAQQAHQLTIQRFGRTVRLYAPLYLSNFCTNSCRYCGFNAQHKFKRKRLTIEQAVKEADIIASEGFRDILLVSGDDRNSITVDYLAELTAELRNKFSSISIEIYQMTRAEYQKLFKAGIEGVTIYQETYNRQSYHYFHSAGSKAEYDRRLRAPDDIAAAGMREVGLGVLLGLDDWRIETLALAEHAHYLMKHYWQSHISFSFPRLRPAYQVPDMQFSYLLTDKNLVQMITALRLCFPDAGLVISTREPAHLRDNLVKLGVTKLSAGSKTSPGGYSTPKGAVEQFEIDDNRSPSQIAAMIKAAGLEPVWKDWDKAFIKH